MASKFTIVVEGNIPEGMSGNALVNAFQVGLNRLNEQSNLDARIVDVKTEGPSLVKAPASLEYQDWDNSHKAWQ